MRPFAALEEFFGEFCTSQMCSAQMCQHPMRAKREAQDTYRSAKQYSFRRSETPPGFPSARTSEVPHQVLSKGEENFRVFTYKTESGKIETFSLAILHDSKKLARQSTIDESSDVISDSGAAVSRLSVSKDLAMMNGVRSNSSQAPQPVKVTLNKRLQEIKSWRNTVAAVFLPNIPLSFLELFLCVMLFITGYRQVSNKAGGSIQ